MNVHQPCLESTKAPCLSAQEFAKLCEFFYRKTGILFNENKRYFVERRIFERMEETEQLLVSGIFTRLLRFETSGQEMQRLVNTMTVNETYFFREDYQFDALVSGILPEICRDKKMRRTQSGSGRLPCSTGEEPYSIAIYILERMG